MTNQETEDFAALLDEFAPKARRNAPQVGQVVSGKVISIGASSVFIDLEAKSEGVIERDELADEDGNLLVKEGDTVEARVVEVEGPSGCIVLRRTIGKGADAAQALRDAYNGGLPVEGSVTGVNKGGLEVTVAGMRAFCPISQVDVRFVESPEEYVGKKLQFKVTRLEGKGRNVNVVVSRKDLLKEQNAAQAASLRDNLKNGAVLPGKVTALKEYGAFVDLGGLEGMLHVSEMSHQRINSPSELLNVGDEVTVKVIGIEPGNRAGEDERISLSMKALQESPWQDSAREFEPGQQLEGQVVRLQPFGAFVEIAPGVDGLVHISELGAHKRIAHPKEVVSVGDKVNVTILTVDPTAKRISLTMRSKDDIPNPERDRQRIAEVNAKQPSGFGTFGDLLKDKL